MKSIIAVALAVVAIIILSAIFGFIPLGGMLDDGLDTQRYKKSGCTGSPDKELLDQKAYILSYKDGGWSEKIIARGSVKRDLWSHAHVKQLQYIVYLKENIWSDYEIMSENKNTSMYFTNPNPGYISFNMPSGEGAGHTYNVESYNFRIIGDKYAGGAIKVVLKGLMDWNQMNPLDKGYEWLTLASDEAFLYSGYGGLYLPTGLDDGEYRPYDTFEVGQIVDIRVETAQGGYAEDNKPWRVTLNEPYSGNIEALYDDEGYHGGGIIEEEYYENDVTNGHFRFTVTEEMARISMDSSDPYTIRIWNVLLPRGSLYIDFLDFTAKAPGDVEFGTPNIQAKVGEKYSLSLSAESSIGIDYFRVSVIYGSNDVLLPSDPLSKLWIINTVNIGNPDNKVCSLPQKVEFTPEYSSYVTVHAKAFDIEGRASVRTRTWTLWAYKDNPVPDEVIEDETGEEDYGGGQTSGYLPWDPEGGNWETPEGQPLEINWWGVLMAVLIILGMAIIGLLYFGGEPKMMVLLIIAGIIISLIIYAVFFTDLVLGG